MEDTKKIKILDCSALLDERVKDIAMCGFLEGTLVIPNFVLLELQSLNDSHDQAKHNKGKRALEFVQELQHTESIHVMINDDVIIEHLDIDAKLLRLADKLNAKIVTQDSNLIRGAQVMQVPVLNLNELVTALKSNALPGDILSLQVIKQGKEKTQGVGYLTDGTMVVIDGAGTFVNQLISIVVTNVTQTAAGRMIFGKIC